MARRVVTRWSLLTLGALGAVGALLAAGVARADVIVLTSGVRLEGRVVAEDDRSLVLELPGGRSRMTFERAQVASVVRTPREAVDPAVRAVRDEWYLLKSGERTVGVRHLRLAPDVDGTRHGWRFDEDLVFLGDARTATVRVQRIEQTTDDFLPVALHYAERSDAPDAGGGAPYELVRGGNPETRADGQPIWAFALRDGRATSRAEVVAPAGARSPLALREALVRAAPRVAGLVEMPLLDPARGEARTIRAGFTALDAGPSTRIDVLRVEDGDRALTSRWAPGDPPRCDLEDVAPGVVAIPCTREQAEASLPRRAAAPDPRALAQPSALRDPPKADAGPHRITLPDVGIELTLPDTRWVADPVAPQADDVGVRVVARAASRLDAADLRVEWDPRGARGDPAEAERDLLARLRVVARDLRVETPRAPVPGLEGAWRLRVVGTVREESLWTWVLVADRGTGRVTVLVACPKASVADVGGAVEALLASFRRL